MGDLRSENLRLQKLCDILESQPELILCMDKDGRITYLSDRASTYMKSSVPEDSDDDPTHIGQLLTPESVETVLECIAQVRSDGSGSQASMGDHVVDGAGYVSSVKSVCYHDASGFQVAGYIRCSRLVRRAVVDDNMSVDANGSNGSDSGAPTAPTGAGAGTGAGPGPGPPAKKSRTANNPSQAGGSSSSSASSSASSSSASSSMALTALNIAAASLADHPNGCVGMSGGGMGMGMGGQASLSVGTSDSSSNDDKRKRESTRQSPDAEGLDEEFVCVIRPADASFPISGGSQLFSSLLSTASMVAHDLELRSSGRGEDLHGLADCRGSPSSSGSSGSHNGFLNGTHSGTHHGPHNGPHGVLGYLAGPGAGYHPSSYHKSSKPRSESSKATSYETGSDENGEDERDEQEPL